MHQIYLIHLGFAREGIILIDKNGGDEENRTPDPLLARQVLSQLSYAPIIRRERGIFAPSFVTSSNTSVDVAPLRLHSCFPRS